MWMILNCCGKCQTVCDTSDAWMSTREKYSNEISVGSVKPLAKYPTLVVVYSWKIQTTWEREQTLWAPASRRLYARVFARQNNTQVMSDKIIWFAEHTTYNNCYEKIQDDRIQNASDGKKNFIAVLIDNERWDNADVPHAQQRRNDLRCSSMRFLPNEIKSEFVRKYMIQKLNFINRFHGKVG